jgi:glycine dehydrogenase subunit 1
MRYIPHTDEDVQKMLNAVGVQAVSDLFQCIPPALRLKQPLNLPEPLDEGSLIRKLGDLSRRNSGSADRMAVFLGAGAYRHQIPVAVDQLLLRGEFFTAYTPYQPEVSQGTLQAIFEYQTMMASLTGTEVVNASMYDGASATAEALLMAQRIKKKRPAALVARSVHPEVRAVCRTYVSESDCQIAEVPFGKDGRTDLNALRAALSPRASSFVVQQPNALGCIEPLDEIAAMVHEKEALLIVVVLEPLSLGLLEAPGCLGADIVTGEGMGLSTGLNFGGPGLGIFGTSMDHVWQMPGRLVGQTVDNRGQRAFVLTLSTREQHIRRARATSNICSNEGMCALAAAMNLSLYGKNGFEELARTNAQNARAAFQRITQAEGVSPVFSSPFFNEFAIRMKGDVEKALGRLEKVGILGGLPLGRFYPEMKDCLLIYVNEQITSEQIENYVSAIGS